MKNVDIEMYKELVLSEIPAEPLGKTHRQIACNVGLRPVNTRDIIRMLRDDGYPICSNSQDGYWMATTSQEIQECINMFQSYINSMTDTIQSLQEAKIDKLKEEGMI